MLRCCSTGAQPLPTGIAQLGRPTAHAPPLHVCSARRRHTHCTAAAQTDASQLTADSEADSLEVSKVDGDAPQAEDAEAADASGDGRYPERSPITGGWYGGEIGLQQFIEEAAGSPQEEKEIRDAVAAAGPGMIKVKFQGKEITARVVGDEGGDPIYIGFDKGELAKKRSGPGSFIVDDQRKYPQKESLGPLSGVVGGFAGGEQGVRQFVEEGTIKLADTNRSQQSPLIIAGIVAVAGTIGGLLFLTAEEAGEEAVEAVEQAAQEAGKDPSRFSGLGQTGQALTSGVLSMNDTTKLGLEVALGSAALVAFVLFVRSLLTGVATNVLSGAGNVAKLAVFWTVVAVAFKFVIEH